MFLFPPSHSNTSGEKKSFSKPAVKFWAFEDYSMPVKYFYLRFCIKMEKIKWLKSSSHFCVGAYVVTQSVLLS